MDCNEGKAKMKKKIRQLILDKCSIGSVNGKFNLGIDDSIGKIERIVKLNLGSLRYYIKISKKAKKQYKELGKTDILEITLEPPENMEREI